MRRWFATSVVCLVVVLAVSLRPVTRTVYVPAPKAPIPAAQSVETVLLAYRPTLNTAGACWSVYYDLPCLEMRQFAVSVITTPLCNPDGDVCTTMLNLLKHRLPWVFLLPMLALTAVSVDAQTPVSICVIGDSSTDSYQAEDNRGGSFHAVSFAWYEQIVRNRAISAGAWAAYGDARRTDYANNASRTGATASWIGGWGNGTLSGLNLTGIITGRIAAGECDIVAYSIGANDYAPYYEGGYGWVYNGTISPQARAQNVIDALNASITALYAADPTTQIVIVKVPDLNNTPLKPEATYPDPAKRALVSQSIAQVNAWIDSVGAGSVNAVAVDTMALFTNGDIPLINSQWSIVNPPMNFWTLNNNPALGGFLAAPDGHGGTLFECKIASLILRGANTMLANDVPEFNDAECLQHAGLFSAPTNTPAPPTATPLPPTDTPVPATSTPTATITNTPPPTVTPVPATDTPTVEPTATSTSTPAPTATPTAYPAIMVWHVGLVDTLQYTNNWIRSGALTSCAGYGNWAGIYLPNPDGSYQALKKMLCWN